MNDYLISMSGVVIVFIIFYIRKFSYKREKTNKNKEI